MIIKGKCFDHLSNYTTKFFMEVKQISWQNVYVDIKG